MSVQTFRCANFVKSTEFTFFGIRLPLRIPANKLKRQEIVRVMRQFTVVTDKQRTYELRHKTSSSFRLMSQVQLTAMLAR